jgi:hypothetical protein
MVSALSSGGGYLAAAMLQFKLGGVLLTTTCTALFLLKNGNLSELSYSEL